MKMSLRLTIGAVVFTALTLPAGCGDKASGPPPVREAAPVTVAPVVRKAVTDTVAAVGTVEASKTVQVRSQVGGTLVHIGFVEGREVAEGDLLFRIDPAPFKADLNEAEANLAKDLAQLEGARRDEGRYHELLVQGAIAPSMYEKYHTTVAVQESTVQADRAAVENARLALDHTTIRAPMKGLTGKVSVDLGNLVRVGDAQPLVVINRIDPVEVGFSVPEAVLQRVREAGARGPVKVIVAPQGQEAAVEGTLDFVDNEVDRTTGTVHLRASFPNAEKRLWPGQFVSVSLVLSVRGGALVVPAAAVQASQKGSFVWVIRDDGTAEIRTVAVSRLGDLEAVIESGLAEGERVVTDGAIRLTPGSKTAVRGTDQGAPAPPARP